MTTTKPPTEAGLRRMLDDREIELTAIRAQRDEMHNAMNAYFTASRNEGRIPGQMKRLMDAELRCKTILAQTSSHKP